MTCIVALQHKNKVWMGADSAGVAGTSSTPRKDQKLFNLGNMLIGFAGSFRMGQILGYAFQPPAQGSQTEDQYMCTTFIDAVRETFHEKGFLRNDAGQDEGGTFLVAYKRRIFRIDADFQVGESFMPYESIGCGFELALGSLYSTSTMKPKERVLFSLEAASQFSSGVRGPFLLDKI